VPPSVPADQARVITPERVTEPVTGRAMSATRALWS